MSQSSAWIHGVQRLEKHDRGDAQDRLRFGEHLASMPARQRARFSPTGLQQTLGLSLERLGDLLLAAVKAGLLEMSWDSHCAYCGSMVHGMGSLNLLEREFYCTLCEVDVSNELDDQVEINFRFASEVGGDQWDPFSSAEDYAHYCFSEHLEHSPAVKEFLESQAKRGFIGLEPGKTGHLSTVAKAGEKFRLISLENDARVYLNVTEGAPAGPIKLRLTPAGFEPIGAEVAPGRLEVELTNELGHRAGALLLYTDQARLGALLKAGPPKFHPFVSGKDMLNSQQFREFYPVQNLPADLGLNLRELTILFTDLKGSTELYGTTGDLAAYKLVRAHFEQLTEAVRLHRGAIVKTMGDAVMASFSRPKDALDAAIYMVRRLEELDLGDLPGRFGLKVGLHTGAAIAVNANQNLDFFGQTVNIAARVQGLAQAGEIWFSEAVFKDLEVSERLKALGAEPQAQVAQLRGVSASQQVYCLTVDAVV